MEIEKLKKLYNLSQDYALLERLLLEGNEIPCFVTYDWNHDKNNPIMVTDIAYARFYKCGGTGRYDRFSVGCRGTGFIDAYPNDEWESRHYPFSSFIARR